MSSTSATMRQAAPSERHPPRPPPGSVIAVHPSTDGPVILRRVLGEDDRRRAGERDSKRKWRTAKSPDQIARYRARGRRRAEDDDQDHPNFGEEHRQDTISDRGGNTTQAR